MKAAFLGLGAMGSRMAHHLVGTVDELTVWNRTLDRAVPFQEFGARVGKTPFEAVAGADIVFSMVRDDAASHEVWLDDESGAVHGLSPRALAVECSTLTPTWVRQLSDSLSAREVGFVDAPLAGSRPQAEAKTLIFFAGGKPQAVERATPVLKLMGAAVHETGPTGTGASMKLAVNAVFGAQLALLGEQLALAERSGLSRERLVEILAATPVISPAALGGARAMIASAHAPAFPIDLVAKDFGMITETAQAYGADIPVSTCVREVFVNAINQGLADHNITAISQYFQT